MLYNLTRIRRRTPRLVIWGGSTIDYQPGSELDRRRQRALWSRAQMLRRLAVQTRILGNVAASFGVSARQASEGLAKAARAFEASQQRARADAARAGSGLPPEDGGRVIGVDFREPRS